MSSTIWVHKTQTQCIIESMNYCCHEQLDNATTPIIFTGSLTPCEKHSTDSLRFVTLMFWIHFLMCSCSCSIISIIPLTYRPFYYLSGFWVQWFVLFLNILVLVLVLIMVLITAGNILVVCVILVERKMKTFTNWMIINLAVADLTVGLFCIPVEIPLELNDNRQLIICAIFSFILLYSWWSGIHGSGRRLIFMIHFSSI